MSVINCIICFRKIPSPPALNGEDAWIWRKSHAKAEEFLFRVFCKYMKIQEEFNVENLGFCESCKKSVRFLCHLNTEIESLVSQAFRVTATCTAKILETFKRYSDKEALEVYTCANCWRNCELEYSIRIDGQEELMCRCDLDAERPVNKIRKSIFDRYDACVVLSKVKAAERQDEDVDAPKNSQDASHTPSETAASPMESCGNSPPTAIQPDSEGEMILPDLPTTIDDTDDMIVPDVPQAQDTPKASECSDSNSCKGVAMETSEERVPGNLWDSECESDGKTPPAILPTLNDQEGDHTPAPGPIYFLDPETGFFNEMLGLCQESNAVATPGPASVFTGQVVQGMDPLATPPNKSPADQVVQESIVSSNQQTETERRTLVIETPDGQLQCFACDFITKARYKLMAHLKSEHGIKKPFICDECGNAFSGAGSLCQHKQLHYSHYEPCICPVCEKGFGTKKCLSVHMKVHRGEDAKNFRCNQCEKRFFTTEKLKNHMAVHTGERRFECPDCKKQFKQTPSYHRHRKMRCKGLNSGSKPPSDRREPVG